MFSAIDYLTDYSDLERSLKNIRGLLRDGGVFVFDFWNGNAVVNGYSPTRVRRAEKGDQAVIRIQHLAYTTSRIITINFDFMLLKGGSIVREFSSSPDTFFPQEMMDLLAASGFAVVHRCPP